MNTQANKPDPAQDEPRKPRVDPRYDVDILAALMSEQQTLIAFAHVANMSAGGAKLKLTTPAQVPPRFNLLMCGKTGPRRQCARVWQTEDLVGVRFIRPEDDILTA
jgi:PilZ domain